VSDYVSRLRVCLLLLLLPSHVPVCLCSMCGTPCACGCMQPCARVGALVMTRGAMRVRAYALTHSHVCHVQYDRDGRHRQRGVARELAAS
jgi:hypothetical protein